MGEKLLNPEKIGDYFKVNNPSGIRVVLIDIGQPRISSTARALLLANAAGVDEVHFQPWKYVQRYSRLLGQGSYDPTVVINQSGEAKVIILKETPGGPNDPKENFDPVQIVLQAGLPPERLRIFLGIRDPFAQFESWLKFDNNRRPEVFLGGLNYLLYLYNRYERMGLRIEPFIFELQHYNPRYIIWSYGRLVSEVQLPENLSFGQGEKIVWHEANPALDDLNLGNNDVGSSYYRRVVAPVAQRGKYDVPPPRAVNMEMFANNFPHIAANCSESGIAVLKRAATVYLGKAWEVYHQQIENGLPPNNQFEEFLRDYKTSLQKI